MRSAALTAILVLLVAPACATTGSSGSSGGGRNMLTTEQLREVESNTSSAYEAIQRLRPRWLRSRGSTVAGGRFFAVVYVDGSRYGELDVLRTLEVGDIDTMRFINSRDATTRYGTGHPGGVIAIATRN